MDLDTLETHDRLLQFKEKNEINIFEGANDCIKKNSLSLLLQDFSPYIYVFAHPRTSECLQNKVMYWQPRLTKPKAQTNSYLFRVLSHSDEVEIIWMLPPRHEWNNFAKGAVCENEIVIYSIDKFLNYREELEASDPRDLPEKKAKEIYEKVIESSKNNKLGKKLILPKLN